mgnify:CR=1 FL=1
MKYHAVIEWAGEDYNGYLLELPGCAAAGDSVDETVENLEDAARLYLAEGGNRPQPEHTIVELRAIEVSVP